MRDVEVSEAVYAVVSYSVFALAVLLVLVIVVGYPLIVIVGLKNVNLNIVPYLFVLHLAISQLLVFFVPLPPVIPYKNKRNDCSQLVALLTLRGITTELIIFAIILDRFKLNFHRIKWASKFPAVARAHVLMAVIWTVGLTTAILEFIFIRNMSQKEHDFHCHYKFSFQEKTIPRYVQLHVRTMSSVLFIITVLKCWCTLFASRNETLIEILTTQDNGASGAIADEPEGVNQFVLSIAAAYVLIPFPTLLMELAASTRRLNDEQPDDLASVGKAIDTLIFGAVSILKGASTPLLCYNMGGDYRTGLSKLFRCRKPNATPQVVSVMQQFPAQGSLDAL